VATAARVVVPQVVTSNASAAIIVEGGSAPRFIECPPAAFKARGTDVNVVST
jgi:hypothetical protein